MKKKKYLPLYYKWLKYGLPSDGLCTSLNDDSTMNKLLSPDNVDSVTCPAYWAFNGEVRTREYNNLRWEDKFFKFTPLRQNIVLFLAAMNDEL